MTQSQSLLQGVPPKIQIPVLGSDVLTSVALVLNGEGRGHGFVENIDGLKFDLDVSGGHLGVFALALKNLSDGLDHELSSEGCGGLDKGRISVGLNHQLGDAITVAEVYESHSSEFPRPLNPTGQGHFLSYVGDTKLAASVVSVHIVFVNIPTSLQI